MASFHAPNDHYIPPTTSSLEALLRDLKLDPVEKAETEAGISVKMKKSGIKIQYVTNLIFWKSYSHVYRMPLC